MLQGMAKMSTAYRMDLQEVQCLMLAHYWKDLDRMLSQVGREKIILTKDYGPDDAIPGITASSDIGSMLLWP